MNWQGILQTVLNAALQFGAAYGTAWAAGGSNRAAVGAGIASLTAGQVALHQTAPTLSTAAEPAKNG